MYGTVHMQRHTSSHEQTCLQQKILNKSMQFICEYSSYSIMLNWTAYHTQNRCHTPLFGNIWIMWSFAKVSKCNIACKWYSTASMCTHTMHARTHTYTHTHACTHILHTHTLHTRMHTCMHATHARTHAHTHTQTHYTYFYSSIIIFTNYSLSPPFLNSLQQHQ